MKLAVQQRWKQLVCQHYSRVANLLLPKEPDQSQEKLNSINNTSPKKSQIGLAIHGGNTES